MEKLYSLDSYLKEFSAEVTGVSPGKEGWEVSLSRSAFYPESGGQPADHGWINAIPVTGVIESGEGQVHHIPAGEISAGQEVICRIDWNRRFDHMQHHTGQHILSQAFLETSGAETISFHLGKDDVTIDLSVESLPADILMETETRANKAVTDNLEIKVLTIDSDRQSDLPIRKPSSRVGPVRIIGIGNWDFSPCGGTHCGFTGEIGVIKITGLERVRQQLRVHFCCGGRALRDFQKKTGLISSLGQLFSCGESDLLANLNKQKENNSRLSGENQRLKQKILSLIAEQMKQNVQEIGGFRVAVQLVEDLELADLNKLASILLGEETADIVLLAAEQPRPGVLYAGSSCKNLPDLRLVLKETQGLFGGKGGGSPDRVQAGGTDRSGLIPALEKAKELIRTAAGTDSAK